MQISLRIIVGDGGAIGGHRGPSVDAMGGHRGASEASVESVGDFADKPKTAHIWFQYCCNTGGVSFVLF